MAKTQVLNLNGDKVKDLALNDSVWAVEVNEPVMHDAIVLAQASMRQGTASTKTRSEVSGGGRKPWRQKGTGRARQGSTRSPQWVHGGVVFAPKPRDFSKKLNTAMKRKAFVSALSTMAKENALVVVDSMNLEPKTKAAVKALDALKLNRRVTVVTESVNENALRAFGNLPEVNVTTFDILNTYDLVVSDYVLVTKEAVKKIEEGNK